jgi:hypothetical protein
MAPTWDALHAVGRRDARPRSEALRVLSANELQRAWWNEVLLVEAVDGQVLAAFKHQPHATATRCSC